MTCQALLDCRQSSRHGFGTHFCDASRASLIPAPLPSRRTCLGVLTKLWSSDGWPLWLKASDFFCAAAEVKRVVRAGNASDKDQIWLEAHGSEKVKMS